MPLGRLAGPAPPFPYVFQRRYGLLVRAHSVLVGVLQAFALTERATSEATEYNLDYTRRAAESQTVICDVARGAPM